MKLRRLRFTAAEIAETLGMGLSTVSGILARSGMGKLGRLGLERPVRYERSRPGELLKRSQHAGDEAVTHTRHERSPRGRHTAESGGPCTSCGSASDTQSTRSV